MFTMHAFSGDEFNPQVKVEGGKRFQSCPPPSISPHGMCAYTQTLKIFTFLVESYYEKCIVMYGGLNKIMFVRRK